MAPLRQPVDEVVAAVLLAPGHEAGVVPHSAREHRRVVFRADDGLRVGGLVFEPQDGVARFVGQDGADARSHAFGEAVVGRAASDVDHVHLPHASVPVAVGGVPLDALLFGVDQVGVFDTGDARMRGDERRGTEALLHRKGVGVDVHVDVEFLHHQARGEAADEVHLRSDRLPAFDQFRFGNDLPASPLILLGDLPVRFHSCFRLGSKGAKVIKRRGGKDGCRIGLI